MLQQQQHKRFVLIENPLAKFTMFSIGLALTACVTTRTRSIGYQSPTVPGITIVPPQVAERIAARSTKVRVPIVGRYDRREVVNELLATAWRRKAPYVTDLQVVSYSKVGDRTRECRVRLRPVEEAHESVETVTTPGGYQERRVMRPTTRPQTTGSYQCRNVPHTELRREPHTSQSCGYSGFGRYRTYSCRTVTRYRTVSRSTTRRQCSYTSKTTAVTRYEHTTERQYVPPKTRMVTRAHRTRSTRSTNG